MHRITHKNSYLLSIWVRFGVPYTNRFLTPWWIWENYRFFDFSNLKWVRPKKLFWKSRISGILAYNFFPWPETGFGHSKRALRGIISFPKIYTLWGWKSIPGQLCSWDSRKSVFWNLVVGWLCAAPQNTCPGFNPHQCQIIFYGGKTHLKCFFMIFKIILTLQNF